MTTQLSLYNGALRVLKERKLASLTENREPRRLLDDAWQDGVAGGVVRQCLQMGQWVFARRSVMIDYSPSITPDFGYRYAFDHPEGYIKPVSICSDEFGAAPILRYVDEGDYWYTDLQTIYVTYISSGASFGGDMSRWPETFIKVVEAGLAREIAPNLTNSDNAIKWAEAAYKQAMREARSDDAMRGPTRFPPPGTWTTSRHGTGSRNSRWSGG
jgi:hypothetical protein